MKPVNQPDPVAQLQDQIVDLQMRLTFQEDTMSQLNNVISRQDAELLLLREQLKVLVQRFEELQRQPLGPDTSGDERPPHY